ncbi:hypothetical protein CDO73_13220 [Saccharibacillus sp. O23]|uniref:anti-sigma factor family protein n=1 Tax=Saccharibacillus sp. O23 TaxID=2009338 RepID=UPI000B4E5A78|nr:zf-HC2 domain-containing protein [Saccharibacillus sp. O23]OWR30029.1 hypothetical protein CDO73_13220 [Saccharibacillus sp. O23]
MRCFDGSEWERYALETGLENGGRTEYAAERARLEKHLASCARCRETLERVRGEQFDMQRMLYAEVPSASFTDNVMKAIAAESFAEECSAAGLSAEEIDGRTTRRPQNRSIGKRKKAMLGIAAALMLAGGASWYALDGGALRAPEAETAGDRRIPAAERIGKLLHDPDEKWAWTGRTLAYDRAGLAEYPDIVLRDESTGYKLDVLAVLSDGLTATVIVRTTDREDVPVSATISAQSFFWRDAAGEEAADHVWDDRGYEGVQAFTYLLREEAEGPIDLRGGVFGWTSWDEETEATHPVQFGQSLAFRYATRIAQVREEMMNIRFDDAYFTLPDGAKVELLGVQRTPAQIRISVRFRAADGKPGEAIDAAKIDGQKMKYHIEDDRGKTIERLDENMPYWTQVRRSEAYGDGKASKAQEIVSIYSLRELADMDRPLKLVLDSLVLPIEIADRITFDPSAVSPEHPAELESQGDRFAFVGAEMKEELGGPVLELPYTAKLVNEGPGSWEAEDGSGNRYGLVYAESGTRMQIEDVRTLPSSLTLRRTEFSKSYDDLNMGFDIPARKLPPAKKSGK